MSDGTKRRNIFGKSKTLLEGEPAHDAALTRRRDTGNCGGVDPSEARAGRAVRIVGVDSGLGLASVVVRRHGNYGAVEDVGPLHAQIQVGSLGETENPAHAEVLLRLALLAV